MRSAPGSGLRGPQRSKGITRQTNGSVADMSEGVSTLSALLSAFVVHPCTAPLHRQCLMGHSPAPLAVLVRHTVGECWSGVVRHGVRLISPPYRIRHMHAIPPSNERASGRGGSTKHALPNKSNEPASLMHHAWRSCSRARGESLVAPRGQYHPQNWCFSSTRLTSTA